MARPQKKVDEILLAKLAKLHLSDNVIADCLGISVDTLNRRYADKIKDYKSMTKSKMAEVLFDEALNKREPWALKMITQRHLDYADKVEQKNIEVPFQNISDDDLDKMIKEKLTKSKKK